MFIFIQDGPEKNAQTLVRHHFATVSNSVTWFSPKCSELTGNTNERQILNVMITNDVYPILAVSQKIFKPPTQILH